MKRDKFRFWEGGDVDRLGFWSIISDGAGCKDSK